MGLCAIKLSVEVSAVLRSEWTKYCPMLSVCDLLVTFHDAEYITVKPTSLSVGVIMGSILDLFTDISYTRFQKKSVRGGGGGRGS